MSTTFAFRSMRHWAYQYKRAWRGSVVSSVISPALFLAAMGVGLGTLVNHHSGSSAALGGVSYIDYIAPGLLAATAMQTATGEATYPVMDAVTWGKTYFAMMATPLGAVDVMLGHLTWIGLRLLSTCTVYLGVMAAFGAVRSPLALLAVPAGVLTGMAFAAPVMAYAATRRNDAGLAALLRFVIVPMFLFSGVFFPVTQLPAVIRPIAYATPLWNGVDLCRTFALGTATPGASLLHIGYLLVWVVLGVALARWAYRTRLVR
jgi:lipooligosaccharide transport system permease protein